MRKLIILGALLAASACSSEKKNTIQISTVKVQRRDIVIDAQATGVVEPITVVEIKSKAGGQIVKMPVETGTQVKPGDLIVQIETRDVQNQYDQVAAQLDAAKQKLAISEAQKKRSDELFKSRIITATEHEAAQIDFANAQSAVVSARTNLDLRKQSLEDATVRAPVEGTIIERTVALGTVITSATGAFGGGTTLVKMADLSRVRVRALFNETDIGQVRPGQTATVVVDAYPERRFTGIVEKIEPSAVIQQNVTMFPVLVTLENQEGLLKPGMNGETSVLVDQRVSVLSVPNDAVRNTREAATTAPILGLDPDSVRLAVAAQQQQMRGNRGGGGGFPGGTGGAPAGGNGAQPAGAAPAGGATTTSRGDVDLSAQQQGQGQGRGNFQMPDVSDADCAKVTAAFKKKPAEQKKLDDMRAQMMSGQGDRQTMRAEMEKIYAAVGVDARVAGACRRKEMQANGGGQMGGRVGGAQTGGAQGRGAMGAGQGRGATGGGQGAGGRGLNIGGSELGAAGTTRRPRSGLVFVKKGESWEPRVIMMGAANFDYTEVVSGLKEGEEVAMLAAAALQAQRQQQNDRMRQNSGVPGMQQNQPQGGAGGAGGAGRGATGGGAAGQRAGGGR